MAKKEKCPSCGNAVNSGQVECPNCLADLIITRWEIEIIPKQILSFEGSTAIEEIKKKLLSGEIMLSDRSRRTTRVLERVTDNKEHYRITKEEPWKDLKQYADKVFEIQQLYDPASAIGKSYAMGFCLTVGILFTIGANTELLVQAGANIIIAIIIGAVALLVSPTLIGLAIVSVVAGMIYGLPLAALGLRCLLAMLVGLVLGFGVGWPVGYLIGSIVGGGKKVVPLPKSRKRPPQSIKEMAATPEKARQKEDSLSSTVPQEPIPFPQEERYRVVLIGIQRDQEPETAKQGLAKLFKSSHEKIEKMLSRVPVTIKSGLSRELAQKYHTHIKKAGGDCLIKTSERKS